VVLVDLRSDTVTRPSAAMRRVMAEAEVGDDVYGEDPSVRRLEERVAALLGKERALFVPSGTMSNQLALMVHCERGDEVIVGEGSHCAWYESGAGAAWAGVQFAVAGSGGRFVADELRVALKPKNYYFPRSRLCVVENTHNRAGGRVWQLDALSGVTQAAREAGLALHLDGARLWNASVASGVSEARWAAPFDTISVCFSKGLGAPVGSALVGPTALVERAHRLRKMLGGGMRQAGVLAAAAEHALVEQRARLSEDHAAARAAAELLVDAPGVEVELGSVETNIVNLRLAPALDADAVIAAARARGVLIGAMDRRTLRLVTHLDAPLPDVLDAARRLRAVFAELVATG
jgi:threonine aldolase